MKNILTSLTILSLIACNNSKHLRDYQLDIINGSDTNLYNDSVQVYDGSRLVGTFKLDNDAVSNIILNDNQ